MSKYRANMKNVFTLDFSVLPKKPPKDVLYLFARDALKIDATEVKTFQISYTKKIVFIETKTKESAQKIVKNYNNKCTIKCDGKEYEIPIRMEDGGVEVQVFDLPINMPDFIIRSEFNKYGEVISIAKEKIRPQEMFFPNVYTGVYIIRMRITNPIPSYVMFDGEESFVSYPNQVHTCRYCMAPVHFGKPCLPKQRECTERSDDTAASSSQSHIQERLQRIQNETNNETQLQERQTDPESIERDESEKGVNEMEEGEIENEKENGEEGDKGGKKDGNEDEGREIEEKEEENQEIQEESTKEADKDLIQEGGESISTEAGNTAEVEYMEAEEDDDEEPFLGFPEPNLQLESQNIASDGKGGCNKPENQGKDSENNPKRKPINTTEAPTTKKTRSGRNSRSSSK